MLTHSALASSPFAKTVAKNTPRLKNDSSPTQDTLRKRQKTNKKRHSIRFKTSSSSKQSSCYSPNCCTAHGALAQSVVSIGTWIWPRIPGASLHRCATSDGSNVVSRGYGLRRLVYPPPVSLYVRHRVHGCYPPSPLNSAPLWSGWCLLWLNPG
jgi:hypothetical protein